jgi:tetratricopeptide (TPR) repeat protein
MDPAALEPNRPPPDALIVGDPSHLLTMDENDFEIIEGTAQHGEHTGSFLFYANTGSPLLRTGAVPARTERAMAKDVVLTPYEEFVLALTNGKRTTSQIQELSGLPPEDFVAALLQLFDKKAIAVPEDGPDEFDHETTNRNEPELSDFERAPTIAVEREHAAQAMEELSRSRRIVALDGAPQLPSPPKRLPFALPKVPAAAPASPEPEPLPLEFLKEVEPTPEPAAPSPAVPPSAERPAPVSPPGAGAPAIVQRLLSAAEEDKKHGNLVSAKMNLQLALSFDRDNPAIHSAIANLSKAAKQVSAPAIQPKNRAYHEQATAAERAGRLDDAIGLLEWAIEDDPDPAAYNRLGVLLATRKRQFARARSLVETAISLAPNNRAYQHNLAKILQMEAVIDVVKQERGGPNKRRGSSILSFFKRK